MIQLKNSFLALFMFYIDQGERRRRLEQNKLKPQVLSSTPTYKRNIKTAESYP